MSWTQKPGRTRDRQPSMFGEFYTLSGISTFLHCPAGLLSFYVASAASQSDFFKRRRGFNVGMAFRT